MRPPFDHLFLGVGAMKAGTTWLYALLERHPDLFFSFEKEIHYYYHIHGDSSVLSDERRMTNVRDKYARVDPSRNHASGLRNRLRWAANYLDNPIDDLWYRNLFLFRRQQKYCCDFSNLYALLSEQAWRHVMASTENLRVLYTLRDPIKRLWSHVKFHLQVTNQTECLDRWGPREFNEFVRRPFIWENAEYGVAVGRMRSVLPGAALRICFFEDVHDNPRGFLRDLEDFLGIGHFDYPPDLIAGRVNESLSRPMPDFFPQLFATDVARICAELRSEGLTLPASWRAA